MWKTFLTCHKDWELKHATACRIGGCDGVSASILREDYTEQEGGGGCAGCRGAAADGDSLLTPSESVTLLCPGDGGKGKVETRDGGSQDHVISNHNFKRGLTSNNRGHYKARTKTLSLHEIGIAPARITSTATLATPNSFLAMQV